jgi:Bacterial regulatory helix-turn-helix protein, lysR family
MPTLPPLAALRAFETTARLGGLARAAAALNVSTSAVSHQIKGLEKGLGVRLLDRGTSAGRPATAPHARLVRRSFARAARPIIVDGPGAGVTLSPN